MSFPTSGYTPTIVRYNVATEGDFSFNFTVDVSTGITAAEDIADVLDSSLATLAGDLSGISGVSDVHVYKSFVGTVPPTDIA